MFEKFKTDVYMFFERFNANTRIFYINFKKLITIINRGF